VASAAVFLFVNTATVAGIIALTSGSDFGPTFRRMTGPAVLLGAGNVCMGLLAVLLLHSSPWALPALAVPLGLLHAASAQAVRARLASERSQAFVDIEQRLGEAQDPQEIRTLLGDAVGSIFGCQGAVWHDDRWVVEVPPGSGPCPVNPDLATPLRTRGPALGPAVDGEVSAVGLGDAVLVAWPGELGLDREAGEWLERLAASGRVHTARSRAAAGLRQERATLRAVVDGTVDGILVLDPNGTVELCNPAMASLAQLDGPAAIGRAASDVLGEGPWEQSGVHDVVRGTGDNRRVWRVSVSPVHDRERGELRVAVVHDVSAERRVARMKDDMLSIVSHELRTPLTPIKGSAQLLRRRWERMTDTMRVDLLTSIEQRADHLARLVDDLLLVGQLSASDDARLRVQTGPADLAQLARDAVTQLTHAHPRHELALDAPAELPLVTDQLRVRQIVDNLVNNACKYSEPGSRVDVDVTTRDGYGVVRVTDHGRGIPAEDLGRVFERFERVEDPLNMQTGGAGLGLYIVKALSTALGGNVVLESVLGAGTTVTLTLPLDAAQSSATSTGSRRESSDESSDDDRDGSSSSSRVSSIVGSSSS
jgi:signal transduction histidine kinase